MGNDMLNMFAVSTYHLSLIVFDAPTNMVAVTKNRTYGKIAGFG
jgi:hypothetical protein